jgi:hypothetical protein
MGSNLLRSQRLIEVLAGAGEKMSKAEINECMATINRSLTQLTPPHFSFNSNTNSVGSFKLWTNCLQSSTVHSSARDCYYSKSSVLTLDE